MERLTVERRDGQFVGVVQSLRGDTWKTVVIVPGTAQDRLHAAITATASQAGPLGCPFVAPAPVALGRAA